MGEEFSQIMLTIFLGDLTLLLGFVVLLLPLLVTELSRPRDALWGAVVLLLGLGLVSSNDRLGSGSLLAVISGSLLIFRLVFEVAQGRWKELDNSEKARLMSIERWTTGLKQFGATLLHLGGMLSSFMKTFRSNPNLNTPKKKWVRPEETKESKPSDQAATLSKEKLESSKEELIEQPKKTLERHRPPNDS